jgi:hypothetical protein
MSDTGWYKASRCAGDHHCVEVADLDAGVAMRNSQRPEDVLTFPKAAWRDLIAGVKAGDFD